MRKPMNRRRRNLARRVRKNRFLRKAGRRIQARVHRIKRLANPVSIQNDAFGAPSVLYEGTQQFFIGTAVADTLPNTSQFGMSAQFQLKSLIDYSDITQLFDRYKITGVKLKFQFLNNTASVGGTHNLPTMYYAWDGDDANVPGVSQTVLSKGYARTRTLNGNREWSYFLRPRITKEIYNGPLSTGYSSEKACYLDCNSDTIPHFGLKMWFSNWNAQESNIALRIQPEYYLALKDTQ